MSKTSTRRAYRVHLVALSLAAAATAGPLGPAPRSTAAPTPDCKEPYPVAELADGLAVNGVTVSKGTTPEPFTGTVLGVLHDGIAPGLDMVIADLTSPAIDAAGGIWQGMSGSPVYAEDGRLIGAVAYGLAWGGSPVAGITPFEDMVGYLGDAVPAPRVQVSDRMAARIAAETEVTAAQAEQGFRHLPMPSGVNGVDLHRAADVGSRPYVARDSYRVGRASGTAAPSIDTVVAGGNIAAVESLGDVTSAGVGTVTSVCGDRVVAFGHPMAFTGRTSLGLAPADAVYVQEDPLGVPFKVANVGVPGGTITQDRLAGIAGRFGAVPGEIPYVSDLTYGARSRIGTTDVLVPALLPELAFYANVANHDRVIDGIQGGSETQRWTITGTAGGRPFTLRYDDRYRDTGDVVAPAAFNLSDLLDNLRSFPGVAITRVVNEVDVSDSVLAYRLVKVQQRVGGRWVDVTTRRPAVVRAGRTLVLRAQLAGSDGATRYQRFSSVIPTRLAGSAGTVAFTGGNSDFDDFYEPSSLAELTRLLATRSRNDQVQVSLRVGSGDRRLQRRVLSTPLPRVVGGYRALRLVVR